MLPRYAKNPENNRFFAGLLAISGYLVRPATMLTWAAAIVYLATAAACLRAAMMAQGDFHRVNRRAAWSAVALLFVALAAIRVSGADSFSGSVIRSVLLREGDYELRRRFQAPLAAAIVLIGFVLASVALYRRQGLEARFGRHLYRALVASAAMLGLVVLRAVSFHATDALLYAGPVHPNWVLDMGLTTVVAACAITKSEHRPSARRPR
jgi:hypothetical protein